MTWTLEEQKEHRKELVAALRSGRYKQGKYTLRRDNGGTGTYAYCCLGVAEDVRGCEWHDYEGDVSYVITREKGGGESIVMTPEGRDYYGFTDQAGTFTVSEKEKEENLMGLNDAHGFTFSQIADMIEYEPEGLFVPG